MRATSCALSFEVSGRSHSAVESVDKARHAAADSQGTIDSLMTYMYVCLALAAVNALSIAVYFPSVPALPPSHSAGVYAMTNQT